MARTSLFKKKPRNSPEIEGCRSTCDTCSASKLCGGCSGICSYDSHKAPCPTSCNQCPARCWRRSDLQDWEFDIDGYQLDNAHCNLPFTGQIPAYLPQIREKIWNIQHPAYIINIAKLFNPKTLKLIYLPGETTVNSLRLKWQIPTSAKLILSFCAKDQYIDYIWAHQFEEWSPGKDFWQTIAAYQFDAALSIDYSCFLNYPRLDHLTNIKRNALSAQRLALANVPVILDVMIANDIDLDRFVAWGASNQFHWYHLNFQKTFKVHWMLDVITHRCDRIFQLAPNANIIISGIGDAERITYLLRKYPGRISLSSANVSIHSKCGRLYNPDTSKWVASSFEYDDLFAANLKFFAELSGQR